MKQIMMTLCCMTIGYCCAGVLNRDRASEGAHDHAKASTEVASRLISNLIAITDFRKPCKFRLPDKSYLISKTEVTQAQWTAIMGSNPSKHKGLDNPVETVSWNDCQEFIRRLNKLPTTKAANLIFRLPTRTEWNYASRAGMDEREWRYVIERGRRNSDETSPVAEGKQNALGLYDMYGNVKEWCETNTSMTLGGHGMGEIHREFRHVAGSWDFEFDIDGKNMSPTNCSSSVGLRLAASREQ